MKLPCLATLLNLVAVVMAGSSNSVLESIYVKQQ